MILVAGGTGRLGTLVVRQLAQQGEQVRVLTRVAARAEPVRLDAADIVVGDVRHPETLGPAIAGVSVVVSAIQGFDTRGGGNPNSVDRRGNANLIAAAAGEGADLVLVSVVGASPDSPLVMARAKYDAEEALKASGLGWTILRATPFIETWATIVAAGLVFGRGKNPINFVAAADVAAAVSLAAVDPSWRGQTIEIAGPRDLTLNELATLMKELKIPCRGSHHVPRWLLKATAAMDRKAATALAMDKVDLQVAPTPRPDGVPLTLLRTALRRFAQE